MNDLHYATQAAGLGTCPRWQYRLPTITNTKCLNRRLNNGGMNVKDITKRLYRDALHYYLVNAYPEDDEEYYSKWAWLCGMQTKNNMPREARFGCHLGGHMKLYCFDDGFMVDINWELSDGNKEDFLYIKNLIHDDWKKHGIPIHGRIE